MFLVNFLTQLEPLMIKSGHPTLIYVFMSRDVMNRRNKIDICQCFDNSCLLNQSKQNLGTHWIKYFPLPEKLMVL